MSDLLPVLTVTKNFEPQDTGRLMLLPTLGTQSFGSCGTSGNLPRSAWARAAPQCLPSRCRNPSSSLTLVRGLLGRASEQVCPVTCAQVWKRVLMTPAKEQPKTGYRHSPLLQAPGLMSRTPFCWQWLSNLFILSPHKLCSIRIN